MAVRKLRSLGVNLALALGSLVVFLAVAEVATRLLVPPLETRGKFTRRTTAPYGYELIPNASAVAANKPIHVNSLGFRDRARSLAKAESARRIVVVGDSHVFGTGVEDDEIFTRVLEDRLESAAGDDVAPEARRPNQTIEVLNLGVFGYNTTQEVHLLEHRGLAFDPDLVIILYTLSDVMAANVPVPSFRAAKTPGTGANRQAGPEPGSVDSSERTSSHERRFGTMGRFRNLIRRSSLARLVFYRLSTLSFIGEVGGDWASLYTPEYAGWLEAQAALRHAAALARDHGFRLVLAIHPELVRLDNYPHARAHRTLEAFGQSAGIAVVDLMTVYRGQTASSLWIHPDDRHPNARGHSLIADGLATFLRDRPDLWPAGP